MTKNTSNSPTRNDNVQVEFLTGNNEPPKEDEFYGEDPEYDETEELYEEVEDTFFGRPTRRPYYHTNRGYRGASAAPSGGNKVRCSHCRSIMHRIDSCPHITEPSRPNYHSRGQRYNNRGNFSHGRGNWSRRGNPSNQYHF